jgi:hypothetical protein
MVEVLRTQYMDKVVLIPVQKQIHAPATQVVRKMMEVPLIEYVDNHVHIPVQEECHVPIVLKIQKHALPALSAAEAATAGGPVGDHPPLKLER